MPIKRQRNTKLTKLHFLLIFWGITGLLYALKCVFPEIAGRQMEEMKEIISDPLHRHHHKAAAEVDSIAEASRNADRLLRCPRPETAFTDADGQPLRRAIDRTIPYSTAFNDLNDVQLATAQRLGLPPCANRQEAAQKVNNYVYIGASPYYDVDELTHSVPYLVPRAALLLEDIAAAYMDSLTLRGIPFHKFVVTSVTRTEEDVANLTRFNVNASHQSCHQYGTTFDIGYTKYHRVQDPDAPPAVETPAATLCAVLAEVLRDQHERGTCYVKYEVKKPCFHITCR